MPKAKRKPCKNPSCGALTHQAYCDKHKPKRERSQEGKHRQRMYDRSGWRTLRKVVLRNNPLCVDCVKEGRPRLATVVDHIIPHKGNDSLFYDRDNLQPLCKRHHDLKTARGE